MGNLRLAAALAVASTAIALGTAAAASASSPGDAPCTPAALPALGGADGEVIAITDSGLAAGGAQLADGGFAAAYWTRDGDGYHVHALPNDPLVFDEILDVNQSARMVDYGYDPNSGDGETYVYDLPSNTWWRLPGLGGSDTEGRRINAAGVVSGHSATSGGPYQATTWAPPYTKAHVLPRVGFGTFAPGINDAGTAVGFSHSGSYNPSIDQTAQHSGPHAYGALANPYMWAASNGRPSRLPTLDSQAVPFAINDAGTIVGGGDVDRTTFDAVYWSHGTVHDMGGRPGQFTVARALSQGGWASGDSETDTTAQAFVWTGTGTLQYLPDLTGTDGDSNAHAVNDALRQVGGWAANTGATGNVFGNGHTPSTIWQCPAGFTTS